MQFTTLFYAALAVIGAQALALPTSSSTCLQNGNVCAADGSFGNCCSGFCFVASGDADGTCKDNSCLRTGAACQANGSLGFCCSGTCNQSGKANGKCT